MKIEIKSYSHAVGEFNYHIQLTPAFRRKIFEDEKVMKLTLAYVSSKIEEVTSSYTLKCGASCV